jgi:hypothetical protein
MYIQQIPRKVFITCGIVDLTVENFYNEVNMRVTSFLTIYNIIYLIPY